MLQRQPFPADQVCFDSTPSYYYQFNDNNDGNRSTATAASSFLIWFGEGLLCEAGNAKCCDALPFPLFCSSKGYPSHIAAETLFCERSTPGSGGGGRFTTRIYIPSCNADGFESTLPRVLQELRLKFPGLNPTARVVLGGTGTAGIGLAKHALAIQDDFPLAKLVFDSALHPQESKTWMRANKATQLPMMFLQSQYDVLQLAKVLQQVQQQHGGALAERDAFYAIETFGEQMRTLLHEVPLLPTISKRSVVLHRPCGTFGYMLPTKVHSYTRSLQVSGVNLTLTRNKLPFLEVEPVLWRFVEEEEVVESPAAAALPWSTMTCRAFLCDERCPEILRLSSSSSSSSAADDTPARLRVFVFSNIVMLLLGAVAAFASLWWRGRGILAASIAKSVTVIVNAQEVEDDDDVDQDELSHLLDELFELQRRDDDDSGNAPDLPQLSLQVRNVTYFPKPPSSSVSAGSLTSSPILTDVSVQFNSGQLHAIVGASGGGKTTLLELLARARLGGVCLGEFNLYHTRTSIRVQSTTMSSLVGLVKQQDMFLEELTVAEHLHYVYCLKSNKSTAPTTTLSPSPVRLVLDLVELSDALQDCRISQLSGGERKRLSLASQFVSLPRVLLLDEPTSGLDANQSLRLCRMFSACCQVHRMCVVMTIHQARQEIFSLVDSLTVLRDGRLVVTGRPPSEVFALFGIDHEQGGGGEVNLGDELMDAMGRIEEEEEDDDDEEEEVVETVPWWQRIDNPELTEVLLTGEEEEKDVPLTTTTTTNGASVWDEAGLLLSRTIRRGGMNLRTTAGRMALVGGVIVCVLFKQTEPKQGELVLSFERTIVIDYVLLCGIVFLQGVFVGDRYWRERFVFDFDSVSGVPVRWESFALSLMLRFAVTSMIETLAFVAIPVYVLYGDAAESSLATRLLVLTLCGLCTAFQYVLVEVLFMRPGDLQLAARANMIILSVSFLFNGFVIKLSDLPRFLSGLPYAIASYWSFSAVLNMDLSGRFLDCRGDVSRLFCAVAGSSGDSVLGAFELRDFSPDQSLLALMGIWLALAVVMGAVLRRQALAAAKLARSIWVVQEEEEEEERVKSFQCNRHRLDMWLAWLIVVDVAVSVFFLYHAAAGESSWPHIVLGLVYLLVCAAAIWHVAPTRLALWLTIAVDAVLVMLLPHRSFASGIILVQRVNRFARLAMLVCWTRGSIQTLRRGVHATQQQQEEEEEEEEDRLIVV